MNVKYIATAFGVITAGLFVAACASLDIKDLVRAKTPIEVRQSQGLPSTMTLNESEAQYAAWVEDTRRIGEQWRTSLEKGNEVVGVINQLAMTGLEEYGPLIAGVPVLGPILPAATGLLGLFLGTARLRREKEESFNAGLKKVKEVTS